MKNGWVSGELGKLFETVTGNTPPKSQKHYYGVGTPLVKPPELKNGIVDSSEDSLTPEGAEVARVLPPKSVLVSCIGNLGKIGINSMPVAFNQQINAIKPDYDKAIPEFIYYQTLSPQFTKQLHELASGTTVPIVNKSKFNSIAIVLPLIEEQKRIVAILDEAFVGIDLAIANTEKNLANARELFESYLNSVLIKRGEGWFETTLGKEINLLTGFAFKSKGYSNSPDGVSLLRGDNIMLGKFRWQDVKKWPKDDADTYEKYFLNEGDVVLAMDRTWIKAGLKYAQVSSKDLPCLLVQRVARLRAEKNLDSRYLKYLLGSIGFTHYVLSIQTGLGVPHISGKQISDFQFNCPPIDEQSLLADVFDEFTENIDRLSSIYEQKLASLSELKQSLLKKAFSGELTAEPDKRKQEAAA